MMPLLPAEADRWHAGRSSSATAGTNGELELEQRPTVNSSRFGDGEALFRVVCEQGLEGVVAKREADTYRPDVRDWVKHKNKQTARFAQESARSRRTHSLIAPH
jgi:ATP-dependent DNA ligase